MSERKSGSHSVPQYPCKERHLSFASKQAECERCSTALVLTDGNSEVVSFQGTMRIADYYSKGW